MWTVTLPDGKKKHSKKFATIMKIATKPENIGKCKVSFKGNSIQELNETI